MKIKLAASSLEDLIPAETVRLDELNIKNVPELLRLLGTRGDDVVDAVRAALEAGPKARAIISVSPEISPAARRSLEGIERISGMEAQKIQNAVEAAAVEAKQTGKAVTFDMPVKIGDNTVDTTFIVTDTGVARLRKGKATNTKAIRNASDRADATMTTTRAADDAAEEVAEVLPDLTPRDSRLEVMDDVFAEFIRINGSKVRVVSEAEAERLGKIISSSPPPLAKDMPIFTTSRGDEAGEAIAYEVKNSRGEVIEYRFLVADGNGGVTKVSRDAYVKSFKAFEKTLEKFKEQVRLAGAAQGKNPEEAISFWKELGRQYRLALKTDDASKTLRASSSFRKWWDGLVLLGRLIGMPGNSMLVQPWLRAWSIKQKSEIAWKAARWVDYAAWGALSLSVAGAMNSLRLRGKEFSDALDNRMEGLAKKSGYKSYDEVPTAVKGVIAWEAWTQVTKDFPSIQAVLSSPSSEATAPAFVNSAKKLASSFDKGKWGSVLLNVGNTYRNFINYLPALPWAVVRGAFNFIVDADDEEIARQANMANQAAEAGKRQAVALTQAVDKTLELRGTDKEKIKFISEKIKEFDTVINSQKDLDSVAAKSTIKTYTEAKKSAIEKLKDILKPYTAVGWSGYKKAEVTSAALDAAGLKGYGGIEGVLKKAASRRRAVEKSAPINASSSKVKALMTSLKVLEILNRLEGLDDDTRGSIKSEYKAVDDIANDFSQIKGTLPVIKLPKVEAVADQYMLNFKGKKELEDQKVEEIQSILKDVEKISSEDLDKLTGMIDNLKKEEDKEANENKSLDHEYLIRINPAKLLGELLKGK